MNYNWTKIIEAAYPMFMENGYKKTATAEIAKSAGINESTIFRNFETKENLFQSSIDYFAKKAIKTDFDILNYSGDLYIDLTRMIRIIYNLFIELIPSFRLLVKRSLVDVEILKDINNDLQNHENLFSHYIKGMISRNMIKNIDNEIITDLIYSRAFVSSFELLTSKNKNNFNVELEERIDEMSKYFVELLKNEVN